MNISIRHGFKNAMVGLLAASALCCAPCAAAYADEAGDLSIGTFSLNNAGEKADVLAEYEEGLASADPLMAHMERMSDAVIVEGDKGLLSFLVTHKASEEKYVVRVYNAHDDLVAGTEGGFGGQSGMLPADYVKISVDTSKLNLSCGEYSAKCWIEHRASEADSWTKAPVTEVSFRVVENVCNGSHDFALESASEGTTCSNEGWLLDRCTRCEKDQWRWGFGDHVWDAGTVTKEPVSGSPGEKTITCTLCGQTKTEPFRNATVARIAGESASETSAAISSAAFTSSEWVVLARNDDFADAMSATGLAGALECPIILTDRNGLSAAAASEIQRLGATRAYVIGGRGAMPGNFEAQLSHVGCTLERRVFGDYAYDTSVECAKLIAQHGDGADAIVAMGTNFQDALSISSFAYAYKLPIFLTVPWGERGLPASAVDAVRGMAGDIWVPGGPGAVPTSQVEGVFEGRTFHRIYGYDGYETSNAIAHHMIENGLLSAESCVVACGAQGPKGTDALAGAALAGRAKAPVLLVNGNSALGGVDYTTVDAGASDGKEAFMKSESPSIAQVWVLGGAFVMPQETVDRISAVLER